MPCTDSTITLAESLDGSATTLIEGPDSTGPDTAGSEMACQGCGATILGGRCCITCVVCERCDDVVSDADDTIVTARGNRICLRCRDAAYTQCAACEQWNRDDVRCGNGCEDDDDFDDDVDDEFGGTVHSYYYKPEPVFHGHGPLYLGAEIEVATGWDDDASAEHAQSHLGQLGYLKEDSSIGGGFEIVTHPMSYDWAIENFPWHMLTHLHERGCAATDSTGMHVHLSRAGFDSHCHIYRWMKFIYRNENPVSALARRRCQEWAAFSSEDRKFVKQYAKGAGSGGRYRAINTNNADTLELRIFASSLNPAEVQAALGFAAASVEYTRGLDAYAICRHDGWSWSAFADWVAEQTAYAPLCEQMEALSCAF